jgi:hypothetical protein
VVPVLAAKVEQRYRVLDGVGDGWLSLFQVDELREQICFVSVAKETGYQSSGLDVRLKI